MVEHNPDHDLDLTIRLGHGRRVIAALIQKGMGAAPLGADPQHTAFNLGLRQAAVELDQWVKTVNPEVWLVMQREMLGDAVKSKPLADE